MGLSNILALPTLEQNNPWCNCVEISTNWIVGGGAIAENIAEKYAEEIFKVIQCGETENPTQFCDRVGFIAYKLTEL